MRRLSAVVVLLSACAPDAPPPSASPPPQPPAPTVPAAPPVPEDWVVDDFEGESPATAWSTERATTSLEAVEGGGRALRVEPTGARAAVSWARLPDDWLRRGAIGLRVRTADSRSLEVALDGGQGTPRFWRKVEVGTGWTSVSVPRWQFRCEGVPVWTGVKRLQILVRDGEGPLWIDEVRIAAHTGADPADEEPAESIVARSFAPLVHVRRADTPNFRVFSDAPLDASKVGATLEETLATFRAVFDVRAERVVPRANVVITLAREAYPELAARTALEVYAGAMDPKSIASGGYTFLDFSFSSYDERLGERRPVFYHEACHQLASKLLGFRNGRGASWLEEGICYHVQNLLFPQDNLPDLVEQLLASRRRAKIAEIDERFRPSGLGNLHVLTIVACLAEGKPRAKLPEMLEALRADLSLAKAVTAVLGQTTEEFEKEWAGFCRERWLKR